MAETGGRLEDGRLIICIQQGSESEASAAWEELYRRYGNRLVAYLITVKGLVYEELHEAASRTWLRAMDLIGRFEDQGHGFFPWLWAIAQNVCHEQDRQRYTADQRTVPLDESHEAIPDEAEDPAAAVLRKLTQEELQPIIRNAIASAPANYQTVLEARYLCEMSHADIMVLQGWTRNQVDVTLYRAHQWLKKHLLQHYGAAAVNDWLDGT